MPAQAQFIEFGTEIMAHRAYSTGRRNAFNQEVFMGRPAGWMKQLTGRDAMRSPGAPSLRREVERQFWTQIATGITSQRAAGAVGVSTLTSVQRMDRIGTMNRDDTAKISDLHSVIKYICNRDKALNVKGVPVIHHSRLK